VLPLSGCGGRGLLVHEINVLRREEVEGPSCLYGASEDIALFNDLDLQLLGPVGKVIVSCGQEGVVTGGGGGKGIASCRVGNGSILWTADQTLLERARDIV